METDYGAAVRQRGEVTRETRRLEASLKDALHQLKISQAETRMARQSCADLVQTLWDADIYVDDPEGVLD